jgi:hypothetical protein
MIASEALQKLTVKFIITDTELLQSSYFGKEEYRLRNLLCAIGVDEYFA